MKDIKYFPNFWGAVAILISLFMLEILIGSAFYDIGLNFEYGDPRSMVIVLLANGIVFSVFMKMSGINYRDLFHPSENSILSTMVFSIVPLMIILVSSMWWLGDLERFIITLFPQDIASLNMLNKLLDGGFITLVAICFIAPFVEEILFRGIILRGFLQHYAPFQAIVISAVLFGLIHLNIYQIPGAFIFGCIVGYIFYLCKSIWPCIFTHSLANGLSYLYYLENPESYLSVTNVQFNSVFINLLSLSVSLVGMYLLYRLFKETKLHNNV